MWKLNVRFPDEVRAMVDQAIERLNQRPERLSETSMNDLVVFAVRKVCKEILETKDSPSTA